MRIPKDDVVSFVLREALKGRTLGSQRELAEALRKRLRRNNPDFSLGESRARRIALSTPGIKVEIQTRRGKRPGRCPVCRNRLRSTHIRNLRGRKLLFRISCSRCPYKASDGRWVPKRYFFRG